MRPRLALLITVTLLLAALGQWHGAQAARSREPINPCTTTSGYTDGFNGKMNKAWKQYIPSSGPSFRFSTGYYAGCLELNLPITKIYDSWTGVDNAPELLRATTHLPKRWQATTRVEIESYTNKVGGIHAGMVLRFPKILVSGVPWQAFWGIYRFPGGGDFVLRLEESGFNDLAQVAIPSADAADRVDLRIIDVHGKFEFSYKFADQSTFSKPVFSFTNTGTAQVGLITKTWNSPIAVSTLFDWFDIRKFRGFKHPQPL
jgi:hypothetical protein